MDTARVFRPGRSQAVLLPDEFRFATDAVRIRRHGDAVILEPLADDRVWLETLAGPVDADFADAVAEQPAEQDRPALAFFR